MTSKIKILTLILLSGILLFQVHQTMEKRVEIESRLKNVYAKIYEEQKRTDSLHQRNREQQGEAFQKRYAKEMLGLVEKDDIVFREVTK